MDLNSQSAITLVLQANRITKCASHPKPFIENLSLIQILSQYCCKVVTLSAQKLVKSIAEVNLFLLIAITEERKSLETDVIVLS